jgi:hypothetical protein
MARPVNESSIGSSRLPLQTLICLPFDKPFDKLRRGLRMDGSMVLPSLFVFRFYRSASDKNENKRR